MDLIFEIKCADMSHIDIIANYQSIIFNKKYELEHDYIKYEICDNPVSNVLIATFKDKIFGYLDYWITFDSATISTFVVLPDYQKSGVGTSLLKEMFKKLIEQNVFYVTLEVRKSNIKAINLYKKFGFKIATIKSGYYSDGEDAYYMVGEVNYVKNNFSNRI